MPRSRNTLPARWTTFALSVTSMSSCRRRYHIRSKLKRFQKCLSRPHLARSHPYVGTCSSMKDDKFMSLVLSSRPRTYSSIPSRLTLTVSDGDADGCRGAQACRFISTTKNVLNVSLGHVLSLGKTSRWLFTLSTCLIAMVKLTNNSRVLADQI